MQIGGNLRRDKLCGRLVGERGNRLWGVDCVGDRQDRVEIGGCRWKLVECEVGGRIWGVGGEASGRNREGGVGARDINCEGGGDADDGCGRKKRETTVGEREGLRRGKLWGGAAAEEKWWGFSILKFMPAIFARPLISLLY